MESKLTKLKDVAEVVVETACLTSLVVSPVLPIVGNIVAAIDRITDLVHKAANNKAICNVIGERLEYARSILKHPNNISDIALEDYKKEIDEIEDVVVWISGNKKGLKAWLHAKRILRSKDIENHFELLFKRLDVANSKLQFSVVNDTLQGVNCTLRGVNDTLQGVKQINDAQEKLNNDIKIFSMKLGIDENEWKMDDVLLENHKITELRNQPRVIRNNKIIKKKYLTQDVAQKPLNSCEKISSKIIKMLTLLSDCKNVIKFFGVYKSCNIYYLITEWCEHGSLEEYLMRNPNLDWKIKVNIATGIANGLVFCHDRDIFHHDIRSANILLDACMGAKLSNFELSRTEQDSTVSGHEFTDFARYLAPEKIEDEKQPYTKKCDIFSFGIVLWVIAMQLIPYADLKRTEIFNSVKEKKRPEPIDENIPIKYKIIMEKAWDQLNYKRPEAREMYEELTKCLEEDENCPAKNEPENSVQIPDDVVVQRNETIMFKKAKKCHENHNYEEAWSIFYELATDGNGHKESLYYLGYYYEKGRFVPPDEEKALKYYKESADKGSSIAAYSYAETCVKIAREYIEKAAELKQFKAGIKFAEYSLFQRNLSPDICDKILQYLNADQDELNNGRRNINPKDLRKYQDRIEELRNEINQIKNKNRVQFKRSEN